MKAQRHPLTQLGVEDIPGCLIGIDLCIDIVTTSSFTFACASQALIRMRDSKSLVEGLMERAEEDAQQALAEEVAQAIAEAPHDGARQKKAARRIAAHIVKTAKPRPANNRGKATSVWTTERLVLLDAECLLADSKDLLARVNALPGPPCANVNSMRTKFNSRLCDGLVVRPAPAPVAQPAVDTRSSTIPEEDKPEARLMVLGGKGAKDLVEEFGWNLEEAQAFAQDVRAAQKAASKELELRQDTSL